MSYSEANKVQIRKYLGFSATFLQQDPRLEQAITSSQSIADGGLRPDSSTEDEVKAMVAKLQAIDTKLDSAADLVNVGVVDEVTLNVGAGILLLRSEGRRKVTQLAVLLGLKGPRRDVFSPSPSVNDDYAVFNTGFSQ